MSSGRGRVRGSRLFKRDASRRRFESLFLPRSHFLLRFLLAFCLTERVIKCKIGFLLFVCAKYPSLLSLLLSLSAVLASFQIA